MNQSMEIESVNPLRKEKKSGVSKTKECFCSFFFPLKFECFSKVDGLGGIG